MSSDTSLIVFYLLVLLVAMLYSMVGHGGASGYLALMSLFSFAPESMRPAALILNLAVSLIAFMQYYRAGHFLWDIFWPFALASVPAAFLGGLIQVDENWYKKILALVLLFSSLRLFGLKLPLPGFELKNKLFFSLLFGALIGLISGMIGIGGGIILSPLILLVKWADVKQTAAVSALFIFVNSLSGMAGIVIKGFQWEGQTGFMLLFAVAGGLTGSYLGSKQFSSPFLKKVLAFVLLLASFKLVFT